MLKSLLSTFTRTQNARHVELYNEEDIKQLSTGSTNRNNSFGYFFYWRIALNLKTLAQFFRTLTTQQTTSELSDNPAQGLTIGALNSTIVYYIQYFLPIIEITIRTSASIQWQEILASSTELFMLFIQITWNCSHNKFILPLSFSLGTPVISPWLQTVHLCYIHLSLVSQLRTLWFKLQVSSRKLM